MTIEELSIIEPIEAGLWTPEKNRGFTDAFIAMVDSLENPTSPITDEQQTVADTIDMVLKTETNPEIEI